MAVRYERRPISVDDYHRMANAGIFAPDERVELLDGELIAVAPMNSRHAGANAAVDRALTIRFNGRATVRVQLPIFLSDRSEPEPEPDLALVGLDPSEWRERHPLPGDVLHSGEALAPLASPGDDFEVASFVGPAR